MSGTVSIVNCDFKTRLITSYLPLILYVHSSWSLSTDFYKLISVNELVITGLAKVQRSLARSSLYSVCVCWNMCNALHSAFCRFYHWPFHIPQPASGSEPSLAATLHALFELGLGIGRFLCFWLWYVEWTCSCCIFTLRGMYASPFLIEAESLLFVR